ncbi:hypothetical protein [Dyadobacter jiangsuensis]|uniref:Uncharacterized protein n=1 Tax=Dyadobacter jiangsuensis TaxID=1591085 RepID=A0A2P8FP44_9BACT|nr:hypothetical protein [Dyadobacter jiangsuensis]PSL23463.1 hypothetical protein CLV60_11618 [Dyadobacter jiangsuensis]
MNESLQSARNIHQILIVVCTIIGVFAISVKPTENRFDLALNELKTLQAVMDSVNSGRMESIKLDLAANNDDFIAKRINGKIEFSDKTAYSYKTLGVFKREMGDAWSMMDTIIYLGLSKYKAMQISQAEIPEIIDFEGFPVFARPSLSDGWFTFPKYVPTYSYRDRFATNNLLPNKNDPKTAFPRLMDVWEFVKDKNFDDAKVILQQEGNATRKDGGNEIELAGLKVSGEFMYFTGPFIAFILLLYLKMLIDHINTIKDVENKDLTEFPWMLLFRHPLSRFAGFFSIYLYPVGVSIGIIIASGLTEKLKCYWSLGYFACYAVALIFFHKSFQKLKLRINSAR